MGSGDKGKSGRRIAENPAHIKRFLERTDPQIPTGLEKTCAEALAEAEKKEVERSQDTRTLPVAGRAFG
jgi:hypothetical protein